MCKNPDHERNKELEGLLSESETKEQMMENFILEFEGVSFDL